MKVCPEDVLINTDDRIKTQNLIECTLCMDCADSCPKDPTAVEISCDKKGFVFKIESTGALPVERIVIEGIKILQKKVKDFSNQLKKVIRSEKIKGN